MVRLKFTMPVTGGVIFLFFLLALAPAWGSRPWDEPVLCPKCKSDRVVYILYGELKMDEDVKRGLETHKVELGGCIVTPDSKLWECRSCGYSWGNVIPVAAKSP